MDDLRRRDTLAIRGARTLIGDGFEWADLLIEEGRIAEIGQVPAGYPDLDGRGLILAPALIDLHGDAFERQLMPRPGVLFPLDAAILETDRQLAANGIATAYHALTLGWEPGLRSVSQGAAFLEALERLTPRLCVENRVQLRWETFAFEAVALIQRALAGPLQPAIAFNDHTSMSLRAHDLPLQTRPFEQSPEFRTMALDDPALRDRFASTAVRAGMGIDSFMELLAEVWDRPDETGEAIARVAAAGRAAGAPMLSHDDSTIETRDYYRHLGARIAEFPMNREVAEAARTAGDAIVFGAPNALRGGSHIGSLGAGDMVEAGLCDALASDYYYPALLAAVARLDAEGRASRAALWSLISSGPARAARLTDRGIIAPGMRADLVLVDWPEDGAPAIAATLVAGRIAYRARPRG